MDQKTDFLIVGAGIAGASVAYHLAAHGKVFFLRWKNNPATTPQVVPQHCMPKVMAIERFGH